jgi:hypothetical protein
MIRLLEKGIEAVRDLPSEAQHRAGELLLSIAEQNRRGHRLTPEQA